MQPCRSESSVTGLSPQSQANVVHESRERKREVGEKNVKKEKKKRGFATRITSLTKRRAGLPGAPQTQALPGCYTFDSGSPLASAQMPLAGHKKGPNYGLRQALWTGVKKTSQSNRASWAELLNHLTAAGPADSISFLKKTDQCEPRPGRFIYKHNTRNDCPV